MKHLKKFNKLNENVFKKFLYWLLESPTDNEWRDFFETQLESYKETDPEAYEKILQYFKDEGIMNKDGEILSGTSRIINAYNRHVL